MPHKQENYVNLGRYYANVGFIYVNSFAVQLAEQSLLGGRNDIVLSKYKSDYFPSLIRK